MGWIEAYPGDVDVLVLYAISSIFSDLTGLRLKDLEPEHAGEVQRIKNEYMTIVKPKYDVAIVIRAVVQSRDLQVKSLICLF